MDPKIRKERFQKITDEFIKKGFTYKKTKRVLTKTEDGYTYEVSFSQYKCGGVVIYASIGCDEFYKWFTSFSFHSARIGNSIVSTRVGNTFKKGPNYKIYSIASEETMQFITDAIRSDAFFVFDKFKNMKKFCKLINKGKLPGVLHDSYERLPLFLIWKKHYKEAGSIIETYLKDTTPEIEDSYHKSLDMFRNNEVMDIQKINDLNLHYRGVQLAFASCLIS